MPVLVPACGQSATGPAGTLDRMGRCEAVAKSCGVVAGVLVGGSRELAMAGSYRPVSRDQQFLLPVDMGEWLPDDHLAWFLIDVVAELDTSAFHADRVLGGRGRAAYDPDMMLALLLYAYANKVHASRSIERLCDSDVAFRVICGSDGPDHATIARFRAVHDQGFKALFASVLGLCRAHGMVRVGVVSIDGTKVLANASRGANRSEQWLLEQASKIVDEATAVDARQDAEFGDAVGDELPAPLAGRSGRGRGSVRR